MNMFLRVQLPKNWSLWHFCDATALLIISCQPASSHTSICIMRNFTRLPWELPQAAYKAETTQKSYKGSFLATKNQLILHTHRAENWLNIRIYILHYLCTQRNFVQNNPRRITKMTKSTCKKGLKSKIFPPSKANLPTIMEITFL